MAGAVRCVRVLRFLPYKAVDEMEPFTIILALVEDTASPKDIAGTVLQKDEGLTGTLTNLFGSTISNTTFAGWLVLLGCIFAGLAVGRIAQFVLRNAAKRMKEHERAAQAIMIGSLAGPANLALLAVFLGIGLKGLAFGENSEGKEFLNKAVSLLSILAIAWFLYNLVGLVDVLLRRLTSKSATKFDDTVVVLLRKALRIFLLIMFVLTIAETIFKADITAWLAGLGIAGLAVSLAAQDTLKNLFGSVTVLISRPYGLGDRIVFGPYDGTVENISFRDTKIRLVSGHLVTIPNMRFTDGTVENISRRPWLSRKLDVTITYDTPPEKVQEAVQIIRDILAEPEFASTFDLEKWPPRVFFNELNADNLNIMVMYWYQLSEGRDFWTFHAQAEQFNVRLLRAFADRGIEFAFPTRTLYLAGDPKREFAVHLPGQKLG